MELFRGLLVLGVRLLLGDTHRPILRVQWVVWAIERDGDWRLDVFFLWRLCCRDVVAVAGNALETILLRSLSVPDFSAVTSDMAHLACSAP